MKPMCPGTPGNRMKLIEEMRGRACKGRYESSVGILLLSINAFYGLVINKGLVMQVDGADRGCYLSILSIRNFVCV